MTFHAVPAFRCRAAGRTFQDAQAARQWAADAADAHRVVFVVWSVLQGKPTRLQAFYPTPLPAEVPT